jgi:anti-sigma factor RsiW
VDLTLSADQRDLRAALREYLAGAWTPERLRSATADSVLDRKGWRELAEMGVFGLTLPETDGGLGLGLADAAILFEELGRVLVPGPLTATFLAAGLVPGAVDGDAVVTMLDTGEPVAVVEHLASATHVVLVSDDGLFLLPAGQLIATPVAIPLDPLTPVSHVSAAVVAGAHGEQIGSAADALR